MRLGLLACIVASVAAYKRAYALFRLPLNGAGGLFNTLEPTFMLLTEIIGKTITNVYCLYGIVDGWLDTCECYVELDYALYMGIPYGEAADVWITPSLVSKAKSAFIKLPSNPIQNRKIVNYHWTSEYSEKGFIELDNGYFLTENPMAPSGTGAAGIHYSKRLEDLRDLTGETIFQLVPSFR